MLERGFALPPSGYESWFLSTAHGDPEEDRTLEAADAAAGSVQPRT
jgi:glutamate-1-semialdehyde 2,1-aminomutase